jgi:tRNA-dihydrouridine synthase A
MIYPPTPPLSIAPMVDRSHRHFRAFFRCLTKQTLLYTEMLTTGAILRGDPRRILEFSEFEGPVALQVGGDNADDLARCAEIAQSYGYAEINLNVGCPSDRVQKGSFGACLMARPSVVAAGVVAMRSACDLPVTVKHRIGIDEADSYEDMLAFVEPVAKAGAQRFTVHARKAWLRGLSPKQNRDIPPLRYEDVHRLKAEFPELPIEINGGLKSLSEAKEQLAFVDAAMLGRAASDNPWIFADADRMFWGHDNPVTNRADAVRAHIPYLREWQQRGVKLAFLAQPMLNLFAGRPGARAWRRLLSESARQPGASCALFEEAIERL